MIAHLKRLILRPPQRIPQVGDTWRFTPDRDDPFAPNNHRCSVLAVRDGWVQYSSYLDHGGLGTPWSREIKTFVKMYTFITSDPVLAAVPREIDGHWCTACATLCRLHEQGLCCDCGQPWETERIEEDDYPDTWHPCRLTITLTSTEQ